MNRERKREEDNYGAENYRVTYTSRSLQIASEPALGGFRISKTTVNHRRWSVVMKSKKETKETGREETSNEKKEGEEERWEKEREKKRERRSHT